MSAVPRSAARSPPLPRVARAHLRRLHQGADPAAARPHHLRDDDLHPARAAPAVRLRHQHRSEASADRRPGPGRQRRSPAPSSPPCAASGYFDDPLRRAASEAELDASSCRARSQFGVQIPANFGRDLDARRAAGDARDRRRHRSSRHRRRGVGLAGRRRAASSTAISSGRRPGCSSRAPPSRCAVHRRYNPTGETRLNIVPGLMGTILTLTMLIFTALSVTREIERGTMESLLAMPIRPGRDHARQDRALRRGRRAADER